MEDVLRDEMKRLVRAAMDSYVQQEPRPRFSKGGEPCSRRLVYDLLRKKNGEPPADRPDTAKGYLASAIGEAVHRALQAGAVRLGHGVEVPAEFDTGAVRVTGSSDWLTLGKPEFVDAVRDFKCVGEPTWERVAHRPKPEHVIQVNGYAVAQDAPLWVIIYIRGVSLFLRGIDFPQTRIYHGTPDVEMAKDLCAKWEDVVGCVATEELPERIWGADAKKWPCMFCPHKRVCLEE
jgi:hypothetical protein